MRGTGLPPAPKWNNAADRQVFNWTARLGITNLPRDH